CSVRAAGRRVRREMRWAKAPGGNRSTNSPPGAVHGISEPGPERVLTLGVEREQSEQLGIGHQRLTIQRSHSVPEQLLAIFGPPPFVTKIADQYRMPGADDI